MRRTGTVLGAVMLVMAASVANATTAASGAPPTFGFAHIVRGFGVNGISAFDNWTEARDLEELPDGALLVRVTRRDRYGVAVAEGIVRLRFDGSIDPAFAASGPTPGQLTLPSDAGTSLLVRADGRIHLSGAAVLQYTATGEPDLTFGNNGRGFFSVGGPAFELSDGFVLHLSQQPVEFGGLSLQVFSPTGALAESRVVFTGLATNMVVPLERPNGARLVAAYNSPLASEPGHLVVIRSDGTLDTNFGGGDGIAPLQFAPNSAPGVLIDAALQVDGRVLMLFNSPSFDHLRLMRFNSDGSTDTTFGVGGDVDVHGWGGGSVVAEPDGRIDLALRYRFENPPIDNDNPNQTFVVRVLSNGDLDPTFNVNGLEVGSVTLEELGVPDHSTTARALRLRSADLIVARTQFDGSVSSLQLVRIAFDTAAYPLPVATTLTGPADGDLLVPARRLDFALDP